MLRIIREEWEISTKSNDKLTKTDFLTVTIEKNVLKDGSSVKIFLDEN